MADAILQARTPGMNTACPQCGKLAQDITPMGPFARLLCLCRPCDRMWWAA